MNRGRLQAVLYGICAACLILGTGCATDGQRTAAQRTRTMDFRTIVARYTDTPVTVDGKLDEPCWQQAIVYPMARGKDRETLNVKIREGGEVMVCWDTTNLYVGTKFYDSDVVAEGTEDQLHQYGMGDVVELFLKPEQSPWYWELYATPTAKKTAFFYPSRGRLGLPSGFKYSSGLKVGAQVEGTLNNWKDRDAYWTAEMAMPLADLTANGDKFEPGVPWRIFVGRYNYSFYLSALEYTMVPQLPFSNYHYISGYGWLDIVK